MSSTYTCRLSPQRRSYHLHIVEDSLPHHLSHHICAFIRVIGTPREEEEAIIAKKTCPTSQFIVRRTQGGSRMEEEGPDHLQSSPSKCNSPNEQSFLEGRKLIATFGIRKELAPRLCPI
ncbi:hypothetical protein GmHk_U059464 [Glycine max]|nr:hypothetical protein GmHk_U059464 [Glycine max]